MLDWSEVRNWAQFAIILFGAAIGLGTYLANRRQRRFENALRLVVAFRDSVGEESLAAWQHVLAEITESGSHAGKSGRSESFGKADLAGLMLGAGAPGRAVVKILEALNLASYELLRGYADLRVFYSELGEIMDSIYRAYGTLDWVQAGFQTRRVLDIFYPQFARLYRRNMKKFANWPCRSLEPQLPVASQEEPGPPGSSPGSSQPGELDG